MTTERLDRVPLKSKQL